jgi:hypothetical protein
VLHLACALDWDLVNIDVDSAFLNAELKEDIYMRQPKGFEVTSDSGGQKVCKLLKSIYGLKQASREWNKKLDKVIKKLRLVPTHADPYVMCFAKKVPRGC